MYSVLLSVLIQFFAMLIYWFKSLLHLLAGIRPKANQWAANKDDKVDVRVEDEDDEETDDGDVETEDD